MPRRQFGVSTHLYHGKRLCREHLLEIAAHGFETVEVFATRSHFEFHQDAVVADLQQCPALGEAGGGRMGLWGAGGMATIARAGAGGSASNLKELEAHSRSVERPPYSRGQPEARGERD